MTSDQQNALIAAANAAKAALAPGAEDWRRAEAREFLSAVLNSLAVGAAAMRQTEPEFDGAVYDPESDKDRLSRQLGRVYDCMRGHEWRTLEEIHALTGEPAASISAQLRHLRKPRFGSYRVEKRNRGSESHGLFEYRVLPPDGRVEHVVADVPDLRGVPDEFRQREIL